MQKLPRRYGLTDISKYYEKQPTKNQKDFQGRNSESDFFAREHYTMSEDEKYKSVRQGSYQDEPQEEENDFQDQIRKSIDYLHQFHDTKYVFVCGYNGSGKSAVIGSLCRALSIGKASGKFYPNRRVGIPKLIQDGTVFLNNILQDLEKKHFVTRTGGHEHDSVKIINGEFKPDNGDEPFDITFIDLKGEDLKKIMISGTSSGELPSHITPFLHASSVSLVFVFTVSWDRASDGDSLISEFLNYLKSNHESKANSRKLLRVTKWDKCPNKNERNAVQRFIERNLPKTDALLGPEDGLGVYSIGNIIEEEGKLPYIDAFNDEYAVVLWNEIYKTFTQNPALSTVDKPTETKSPKEEGKGKPKKPWPW